MPQYKHKHIIKSKNNDNNFPIKIEAIVRNVGNLRIKEALFFFVHRNRWVRRWLMRPICARKSLGKWEQGMVVVVAVVAVPFLSSLRSSVAAFLLDSLTFASCLKTSRYLSLSPARYSRQLGAIPKDFMETFSVSMKRFFWSLWERLPWDISPLSSFIGKRWSFIRTWRAQPRCDCIKMV